MIGPDLSEARKRAYLVFVGAVIVAALAWWIFGADNTAADAKVRQSAASVRKLLRSGTDIDAQITLQKQANEYIRRQVEQLELQHGLQPTPPFIQATARNKRVHHLKTVYDTVVQRLETIARSQSIADFDSSLGFTFSSTPPQLQQVPYWLTMLQLTTKAAYLALVCPTGDITSVRFGKVNLNSEVLTGPVGRPALLREYPFEMQVTGSLRSILWLVHQLSMEGDHSKHLAKFRSELKKITTNVDTVIRSGTSDVEIGNVVSPLIVRGFSLQSSNLAPIDQVTQLTVTLQLAGMEFLSDEERFGAKGVPTRSAIQVTSARAGASSGGRPAPSRGGLN